MSSSTYRRLPPPAAVSLPLPLRRALAPPRDSDELVIARTALELGLPEVLVAGWLWRAGELGRPLTRRPGARMDEGV